MGDWWKEGASPVSESSSGDWWKAGATPVASPDDLKANRAAMDRETAPRPGFIERTAQAVGIPTTGEAVADVVRSSPLAALLAPRDAEDVVSAAIPVAGPQVANVLRSTRQMASQPSLENARNMLLNVPGAAQVDALASDLGAGNIRGAAGTIAGTAATLLAPKAISAARGNPTMQAVGRAAAKAATVAAEAVGAHLGVRSPLRLVVRASEALGLKERLGHLLRREAPHVVEAAVNGSDAPRSSTSLTPGQVAAPEVTTQGFTMRVPADAAAPTATPPAPTVNPDITAKGGWKKVGIRNWYGTEGSPTDAEWAKMGGKEAKRAWLASRNLIPSGGSVTDVAAAVAAGVPQEQILKLYGEERLPAKPSAAELRERAQPAATSKVSPVKGRTKPQAQAFEAASRTAGDELRDNILQFRQQGMGPSAIAFELQKSYGMDPSTAMKATHMVLMASR